MVTVLDCNLKRFGLLLEQHANRRILDVPGAGAAGGMGAALLAVVKAQLRPGVDIVIEALHLQEAIAGSDLVITGEGRLDIQTTGGKAPAGIAQVAAAHGVPVIAIGGSLDGRLHAGSIPGFAAMFPAVARPCSLEEAFSEAESNLQRMARNVAAAIRIGTKLGKLSR
jgi:glycerate kinase